MGLVVASRACDQSLARDAGLFGRRQGSWPEGAHEGTNMASRWPPNGTKNEAPKGSKMGPKRTSNSRPISYPVLPPFGAPSWGPFGAPLGTSWGPYGRPNPKERLRDAILTCSYEHLEEELRRTSPKWRNGPQVGPNLTAATLLKSSKSGQNLGKTYVSDDVAFFAASALRWPQDGPGGSKGGPGRPKMSPREWPGRAQDGPKTAPGRLQAASGCGRSAMRDPVGSGPGNVQKKVLDWVP